MELKLLEHDATSFRAGYSCPCGCTPSVEYARGADVVTEGCCCGNHFAVGPAAAATTANPKPGFHAELKTFESPWGERLEAAWLVGPSVHGPSGEHDHEHGDHEDEAAHAVDPVCGMSVVPDTAREKGLHIAYQGTDYYFCGKGCKLEFDDDPQRYLAADYVPSM